MKSTKSRLRFPCAALLLLLSFASVSAYYDPGVQRWVNRDPVGELGFSVTRTLPGYPLASPAAAARDPNPTPNAYVFLQNRPTSETDAFGLFLGFGYGNYCGWSRNGPGKPIDALDEACKKHDECLATPADTCKFRFCNIKFCTAVALARCGNDQACQAAKAEIFSACVPAIFIIPFL